MWPFNRKKKKRNTSSSGISIPDIDLDMIPDAASSLFEKKHHDSPSTDIPLERDTGHSFHNHDFSSSHDFGSSHDSSSFDSGSCDCGSHSD